MLRLQLPLLSLLLSIPLLCRAEPAAIENGRSPDGRFEVVIECDKDSPDYKDRYKLKGGDEDYPALLIRRVRSGKVLLRIPWPGDPNTDEQLLSTHCKILWDPQSHLVAMNTNERFYSYTEVYRFQPKENSFSEVPLPSYPRLTGYPTPNTQLLKARSHEWATGWSRRGNLIYYILLSPRGTYTGEDTMYHRVAISFAKRKPRVAARRMLPRNDR